MSYRVLAFDLDGTLLDPDKHILQESLDAIREARRAGVQVLIVTGRHHVAIHPFYQTLQLDTPAICCNGTYLYDYPGKKVLSADPMSVSESRQLLGRLAQTDIEHLMYISDAMLYHNDSSTIERTLNWSASLPEHQRPVMRKVNNFLDEVDRADTIWKFATCSDDLNKLREFTDAVEADMGLSCEWSWINQVDIARKGNSKGRRLQEWVESQGMTMKDVMAFGDNHNDISMLSAAGLGVAMGNAADEVKAHADLIIPDNTQPGIAQAIRRHILS